AVLTESDDDGGAAEMGEKRAAGLLNGLVVGQFLRDEKTGFLFVADDGRGATVGKQARSLGLHESGHAAAVALLENALGQRVSDNTLVVVGKHQDIEFWQAGFD